VPAEPDNEARYKLADALARGLTVAEAAKAAKLAERTVYRLKKSPDFVRMLEGAQERLAQAAPDPDDALALATLRAVAKDKDAPAAARVAASKELRVVAAERKRAAPAAGPTLKVLSGEREAEDFLRSIGR
jgi:hypothetical protein